MFTLKCKVFVKSFHLVQIGLVSGLHLIWITAVKMKLNKRFNTPNNFPSYYFPINSLPCQKEVIATRKGPSDLVLRCNTSEMSILFSNTTFKYYFQNTTLNEIEFIFTSQHPVQSIWPYLKFPFCSDSPWSFWSFLIL